MDQLKLLKNPSKLKNKKIKFFLEKWPCFLGIWRTITTIATILLYSISFIIDFLSNLFFIKLSFYICLFFVNFSKIGI